MEPLRVTRLLMKRIDRQTSLQSLDYEALPYHWDPALRIQQTAELAQCLAEVRDWMISRGPDRPRYHLQDDCVELYQLVAGDWNDQALATLTDFGDTPTETTLITSARLLAHAPVPVLFTQAPLVAHLLHEAADLGQGLHRAGVCTRFLQRTASSSSGSATLPKLRHKLEQARRITENLPHGSVERRFFEPSSPSALRYGSAGRRIVASRNTTERVVMAQTTAWPAIANLGKLSTDYAADGRARTRSDAMGQVL